MHEMQCIAAQHAVMVNMDSNEHNNEYASASSVCQEHECVPRTQVHVKNPDFTTSKSTNA